MSERVYMLPLWLRIWHWTNALLIIALVASGVSLHFADPKAMLLPFSLARDVHTVAGVALCAAYGFFVIANSVSGNWWQYVPKPGSFLKNVWIQTRYYLWDVFRGRPHPFPPTPENNFNALQQIIYWVVMYLLMPALLITGVMFLWPELAPDRIMGVDGLLPVAVAHYVFGYFIFLFMLGHMYLATLGATPTSLLKMMVTGWHEH